ncbi:S-layer homology domain-containing protein, partial [Patescibacteria group bacterium]|nr:S-layer homology domain-containing protein [Patescibacteria group bacterium]
MKSKKNLYSFKNILFLMLFFSLSYVFLMFQGSSLLYKASILDLPAHKAFDGTVLPIQKVPNWVYVESNNWDLNYANFSNGQLIDAPKYDPSVLSTPTDQLVWRDAEDDKIRNAKITYSVPYMGSYLLDGKEYSGSHLAVDIKIPTGTPVYVMANGTVSDVSKKSSGFGYDVVVKHMNMPSLADSNAKETYYSSYSHLSEISVNVGDVVTKGQQIAKSGSSGTATTPHLHFQIDNDQAPWHPYWPFTWTEASNAGLDFFTAVNAGLGKDKAIATTINPMKYVQQYSSENAVYANETPDSGASYANSYVEEEEEEDEPAEEVEAVVVEEEVVDPVEEVVEEDPYLVWGFDVPEKYSVSGNTNFTINLQDQFENSFTDGFVGEFVLSSANGSFKANKAIITLFDFDNYEYVGFLENLEEGRDRLELVYNGETYYSDWFKIEDNTQSVSFSDVPKSSKYYEAITYLAENGFINGYNDGTFRPEKTVTRVEALKFVLEGVRSELNTGDLKFKDIDSAAWYAKYLYTANRKKIVSGYDDKTFRPDKYLTRSEAVVVLSKFAGVKPYDNLSYNPYPDVSKKYWAA